MEKFEQSFFIESRKPIMNGNELLYGLSITITTMIETNKLLEEDTDLWGLFIDRKVQPNDMSPLLMVPIPESELIYLNDEEKRKMKYHMKFYKEVDCSNIEMGYSSNENQYMEPIEIEKDEFYRILNNDMHFMHEKNKPCIQIRD